MRIPDTRSRREFLQLAATAAVAPFVITPKRAMAAPMLRHASVGASGQALADVTSLAKHPAFQLVAVADVDLCKIEPLQQRFPKVRVYQDWREMFARERANIDSVNVSIPDHMHFPVAMEAMKLGKAVYVEKPLCNTLGEVRQLTETARKRRVVSQMGIQVSSTKTQLYGEALVRSGIVGKIKEVHTFSNKNWGDEKALVVSGDPVPAPLDWDSWLGVGASRPFIKGAYHPGEWRRRVGFGTGTLGDMGCHIYSPPYRALGLTSPISVTAYGPSPTADNWATKARVKLTYSGTPYTAGPTVDVWWYDGGELPPDPIREPIGSRWPSQGSVVVGTDGLLVLPHVNPGPFVVPASSGATAPALPEIPVPERDHYAEFVDAVLQAHQCSASFDYAGPLTESVLIGNIAAHFPGETLTFDGKTLAFPQKRDANQYLRREYRSHWK